MARRRVPQPLSINSTPPVTTQEPPRCAAAVATEERLAALTRKKWASAAAGAATTANRRRQRRRGVRATHLSAGATAEAAVVRLRNSEVLTIGPLTLRIGTAAPLIRTHTAAARPQLARRALRALRCCWRHPHHHCMLSLAETLLLRISSTVLLWREEEEPQQRAPSICSSLPPKLRRVRSLTQLPRGLSFLELHQTTVRLRHAPSSSPPSSG